MIKRITNYIKDNSFKINYVNNSVNVINYDKILEIKDDAVTIIIKDKVILIKGKNLKLTKLLEKELLIKGQIQLIEV